MENKKKMRGKELYDYLLKSSGRKERKIKISIYKGTSHNVHFKSQEDKE